MDQTLKLPLSGDVSQLFNIFSMFNAGGQLGLVNVKLGESGDPELERRMLAKVGSYGRQIGQIGQITDALRVVIKMLGKEPLTEDDESALELFEIQARIADLVKRGRDIEKARDEAETVKSRPKQPLQGVIWPLLSS